MQPYQRYSLLFQWSYRSLPSYVGRAVRCCGHQVRYPSVSELYLKDTYGLYRTPQSYRTLRVHRWTTAIAEINSTRSRFRCSHRQCTSSSMNITGYVFYASLTQVSSNAHERVHPESFAGKDNVNKNYGDSFSGYLDTYGEFSHTHIGYQD